jgi:hypothetical protein
MDCSVRIPALGFISCALAGRLVAVHKSVHPQQSSPAANRLPLSSHRRLHLTALYSGGNLHRSSSRRITTKPQYAKGERERERERERQGEREL